MEIIRPRGPESSDADCNRRLDKKVIVVPARSRCADRAEVIGVFVAGVDAKENATNQPLLHSRAEVSDRIILARQYRRIQRAAIGTVSGAAIGALFGGGYRSRGRSALIGGTIGGLFGLLSGW